MDGKRKRTTGATLASVLAVVLLTGCFNRHVVKTPTFAGEGGDHLALAKAALLAGDTSTARAHLTAALKNGQSAEAHYYLALIQVGEEGKENKESGLAHVRESLRAYPTAQVYLLKGVIEEKTDLGKAIASYRLGLGKASEGSATALLLHRNIGVALAKEGEWKDAYAHFKVYADSAAAAGKRLSDREYALLGLMLYRRGMDRGAAEAWGQIRDDALRARLDKAKGAAIVN